MKSCPCAVTLKGIPEISFRNMKVIYTVTREKVGEIEGVACALFSLNTGAVFSLVQLDKFARPFASRLRILFPDSQNLLWPCVMNWRAQPGDMFMAQTC